MTRHFAILLAAITLVFGAFAQAGDPADQAEVEARTEAISKTLRCVVCQNQSIHDSNAPLAIDMRALVEKRVLAGDTNAEVREYLRERYGDYVLMRPPYQLNTLVLWIGPGLLVLLSGIWFILRLRRGGEIANATEMSAEDKARVHAALHAEGHDDA